MMVYFEKRISAILLILFQSSNSFNSDVVMFEYVDKNQKAAADLFKITDALPSSAKATSKEGVDTWKVSLNNKVRDLVEGSTLNVPLPNGTMLSAVITARNDLQNGGVQFLAPIDGTGGIVLTVGQDVTFASISSVKDNVRMTIALDSR